MTSYSSYPAVEFLSCENLEKTKMILPTIHSSGTSARMLAEGYSEARLAVQAAINTLYKVEFNARDYYPQGDAAWKQACFAHGARFIALKLIADELYKLEEHCCDRQ